MQFFFWPSEETTTPSFIGYCPAPTNPPDGVCPSGRSSCYADDDCSSGYKCCLDGCGFSCQPAVDGERCLLASFKKYSQIAVPLFFLAADEATFFFFLFWEMKVENQFIVPLMLVRLLRWTEKNRLGCYHCSSTIFVLCF